jgi:membrane protease YdiL (CAAX protease family)
MGRKCFIQEKEEMKEKMWQENKNVVYLAIGMLFVLALLWVINPDARGACGINIVLLVLSLSVYRIGEYQDDLIGLGKKNLFASIGYGILFTVGFYVVTLAVPGMSIGYPSLPASISDQLKWFLVVIVAPIVESIFFQGILYAYISNFDQTKRKEKKWKAILVQAFGFALFHLGAYVAGFYMYPTFTEGMSAVFANISAFFTAFLFALVAGWWVTRDGVKNILFAIVFHLGMNLISYSLSVAIFLSMLPMVIHNPAFAVFFIPIVFLEYKLLFHKKFPHQKESL